MGFRRFTWVLGLLAALSACHKKVEHYRKIDVHTHFSPDSADHMFALMNEYGIDTVVNLSGEVPGHGLEENLQMAAEHPGRVVIFTNVDWDEPSKGPGYGLRLAEQVQRAHALGARGVKIYKALGLAVRDFQGRLLPVDDPGLDPFFDKAGELGMPVAIHTGDPVAFWQPVTPDNERYDELTVHRGWAEYGRAVPSWEGLYAQLEGRIARSPHTTFIAVHFGNAPEYPERVAALLDKYPNMYIDTAARVPEIGRHPQQLMHDLITRHADRIMFGTDLGVGPQVQQLMLGSTGATAPTQEDTDHFFASTWRYFETWDRTFRHPTPIQGRWPIDGVGLEPPVLRKIYSENAARLLRLDPASAQTH
jgi:predicted TIM-barrel fold metal-dependent hydrolase